jgi:hypothetical protein
MEKVSPGMPNNMEIPSCSTRKNNLHLVFAVTFHTLHQDQTDQSRLARVGRRRIGRIFAPIPLSHGFRKVGMASVEAENITIVRAI